MSSLSSLMAEDDEVEGVEDKFDKAMMGGSEEEMDVEETDKVKVFEDKVDDEDKAEVDDEDKAEVDDDACF